jgi:hypothetical protein
MTSIDTNQPLVSLQPLRGGAGEASVELVELGGQQFVLKRSTPARTAGERRFHMALAEAGLPHLALATHPSLGPGDLLLEYVDGPTLGASARTPEPCGRWGAAVAGMHGIRTDGLLRVDSAGEIVPGAWPQFVERLIERGLTKARASDLPAALLDVAAARLGELRGFTPATFVLVHGDLHANNVLLRGDEAVLFDRASRYWSCPAVLDVALIHSESFPIRYGVQRPNGEARLAAFLAAYGDLPDAEWLDHFALAHSLMRYPSPFVPELRQIIDAVVERLCAA